MPNDDRCSYFSGPLTAFRSSRGYQWDIVASFIFVVGGP